MTVREMAEHLDVTQKMIRRDLAVFRAVGFPIAETVGPRGCKTWRIAASAAGVQLHFTFDEAVALYLGRRFLEPLAGTLFWDAASRAYKKIDAWLTPGASRFDQEAPPLVPQNDGGGKRLLAKMGPAGRPDPGDRGPSDHARRLPVAQATEPVSYDIYPLGLVYHRGSLYLVGVAPRHEGRIRHWKVDRIEAVNVENLQFQRPEGFDLREHLGASFGIFDGHGDVTVKVRFAPAVARYVTEGRWHAGQKLTRQRNGGLLAEFRLSGTEEIKSWLLGFGRHAVVLEPDELKKEILAELDAIRSAYEGALNQQKSRST